MFGGIQVVALGSGAFAGLQFAVKFLVLLLSEKRDGTAKKNKDGNQKATLTAETRRHGEDRVVGSSGHRVIGSPKQALSGKIIPRRDHWGANLCVHIAKS